MCSILISGFSAKEANHEGVVVQELPPEQHEAYFKKWGIYYKTFREYNIAKVRSVSALRPAFTETITCQFGTLSHSTLVVGLLCLLNGAVWDLTEEHRGKGLETMQTGEAGAWNVEALMKHDAQLAEVLRDGISVEVLSWRIMLEEPMGTCAKISHALNESQAIWEALASVANVVGDLLKSSAVAGQIDFAEVKDAVKDRLPQYVNDPYFEDMFGFVINIGGTDSGFIDHMLEYDRRFVDHKKRTLPLQAFGSVNALAPDLPRSNVAILMRACSKPTSKGVCPCPESNWGEFKTEHVQKL